MAIGDLFFGTKDQFKQLPTQSPQQLATQSQLGQSIQPLLQSLLGNKSDFAPIAQQARTQFQTQSIPLLAERLSSLGGQGGQRSSAYPAQLSSAASQLEQGLAAQQQGFNMQNRQLDQGLLSLLLGHAQQPSFENLFMPGRQGLFGSLAGGLGQGLGMTPALLAGGGGGGLLSLLSSLFGGSQQSSPTSSSGYELGGGFGSQNFAQRFGQSRF